MDLSNASTMSVDTLTAALGALPRVPDDIVVHAHPLDIAKGLLDFLTPSYEGTFYRCPRFPIAEDKAATQGTVILWNKTKKTYSLISLGVTA